MSKSLNVLFIYVIFATIVSLLYSSFDNSDTYNFLSLSNFLDYMANVPTVNLESMTLYLFYFDEAWFGIIDWVRVILNSFGYIFGFIRFIGIIFYNIFVIFIYFIKFFVSNLFDITSFTFSGSIDGVPSAGSGSSGAGGGFAGGGGGSW